MNTPGIAGLCERLRKRATASFEANKNFGRKGREWAIDTEVEWQAANILERQAAENKRLRLALAEAGMRIETCPGAYKSHVEIIVQKIQAALTGEDTAGSPTSQNTEPGLPFSDAGKP